MTGSQKPKMSKLQNSPGTLYVVATPIGNLSDTSQRVIETLKTVDVVAAEDTRVTKKLLSAFDIQTAITSLHQHTSSTKEKTLVRDLQNGTTMAVVTDAGKPGISDPGSRFVAMALEQGIRVIPIPGPSALTAALSICGFPTNRFTFVGFPPSKKGRTKFFDDVASIPHTVVLYESKHRLTKTLEVLPPTRRAVVARELTKMHETIYRGTIEEIREALQDKQKGEMVIVLAPLSETPL